MAHTMAATRYPTARCRRLPYSRMLVPLYEPLHPGLNESWGAAAISTPIVITLSGEVKNSTCIQFKTSVKFKNFWNHLKHIRSTSPRSSHNAQFLPRDVHNAISTHGIFERINSAVIPLSRSADTPPSQGAHVTHIPSDLDELILSFLVQHWTWGSHYRDDQYSRNYIKTTMRELGALSLVCRKWALLCQPKLFEYISVSKREDVDDLLFFTRSPSSRIWTYLNIVRCHQETQSIGIPWFHIACLRLRPPHLASSPQVDAVVDGELSKSKDLRTTLQSSYPRHLPPSVLSLSVLALTNVHFESFQKLIRVIAELPSLSKAEFRDLTWDPQPDGLSPPSSYSISRCKWRCRQYRMRGCTDDAGAIWLSTLVIPSSIRRLRQQDAHALCQIGSALVKHIHANEFPSHRSYSRRVTNGIAFETRDEQRTTYLTPVLWTYLAADGKSEWVRFVTLDFESYRNIRYEKMVGHSDWGTIDEELDKLQNMEAVFFVFRNEQNLQHFTRAILTLRMPRLRASRRIRILLLKGLHADETNRWLFCTSSANINEDMKKGKWLDLHGVERYIGVNGIGLIFREFPLPDANVHTIHVT